MEPNSLNQYEVPRDPALAEAFEAFIQQTPVPLDFHGRVMAQVHQRRARHGRYVWWKRVWAWWTPGGWPLWICGATVCALLVLALGVEVGHYVWTPWTPVPTAVPPGHLTPPPVASDTSAPITTALVSPTPNAHGWQRTDVTVTLTAVENTRGTGVQQLHVALAGASRGTHVVHGSRTTVRIAAEGITTLTYGATDQAGHQEALKTLSVQVDKTPPVITVAAHPARRRPPHSARVPVTITGVITDAGSGVNARTATYAVTDEDGTVYQTGSLPVGVTGSYAFTLPLPALRPGDNTPRRPYTLTVRAQDTAGNSGAQVVTLASPAAVAQRIPPDSARDPAGQNRSGGPSRPPPAPLPRPPTPAIAVRSGPGATYEVMTTIAPGGSVVVVAQAQGWYQIQLPDGRQGWVQQTALQPEPDPRTATVVASVMAEPQGSPHGTWRSLPSPLPGAAARSPSAPPAAGTPSRPGETHTASSAEGYTLIRRIYCEDTESGVMQGSMDLRFTSYLSCEEAKNALLVWEQQKDYCRYPKPDPTVVDATRRESPHKAHEWIGTPSCHSPS